MTDRYSLWLIRALLAALLLFGSEILLWSNPTGRPPADWLLLIAGYLALSTLLLDFMMRYRVRDLWGAMTLAGVYGLCAGTLLQPETALTDLPRTLVTRVMGGHTLVGLEMTGLFLALVNGQSPLTRRLLLAGCVIVGLAWGAWVRWLPSQTKLAYGEVSLETASLVGAAGIMVALGLLALVARRARSVSPGSLQLSPQGIALLALLLAAVFFMRLIQGYMDTTALIVAPILLIFCVTILWFRRNHRRPTLLDMNFPISPLSIGWIVIALAVFGGAAAFTYSLPLIGTPQINQFTFIVIGFTLYGLGWLPLVSAVLGLRAYMRQMQTRGA